MLRPKRDRYCFAGGGYEFAPQKSKVTHTMRPISSSMFVAGNFQFVYRNCADLRDAKRVNALNDVLYSHCQHPNSGAEFDLLFAVVVFQPDDFVCPICLYRPVAPRMTHCGHVFCADCIRRHCTVSDPVKCPICDKSLRKDRFVRTDLRLFQRTERCRMQKVFRNRDNCLCFLREDVGKGALATAAQPSAKFSRFSVADREYMRNMIEGEIEDLKAQITIYEEYNDECKIGFLREILSEVMGEQYDFDSEPLFVLPKPKMSACYKIFQEESGRLVFMDTLSTKMLLKQFGSLDNIPDSLEFNTLKITSCSVNQAFRDKHPSLGYLPTGADVQFVLADLTGIVSDDIIKRFSKIINDKTMPENEIEESEKVFTEEDFPTFDSKPGKVKQFNKPKIEIKIEDNSFNEENFPSFGGPKKNKNKPKNEWSNLSSIQPAESNFESDFPSFSSMQTKPKQKPKK